MYAFNILDGFCLNINKENRTQQPQQPKCLKVISIYRTAILKVEYKHLL